MKKIGKHSNSTGWKTLKIIASNDHISYYVIQMNQPLKVPKANLTFKIFTIKGSLLVKYVNCIIRVVQ